MAIGFGELFVLMIIFAMFGVPIFFAFAQVRKNRQRAEARTAERERLQRQEEKPPPEVVK